MATDKTRGPVEQQLLALLNKEDVTISEVQSLLTAFLDCAREDVAMHQTFQGKVSPER